MDDMPDVAHSDQLCSCCECFDVAPLLSAGLLSMLASAVLVKKLLGTSTLTPGMQLPTSGEEAAHLAAYASHTSPAEHIQLLSRERMREADAPN
jgi:hypothetical protein